MPKLTVLTAGIEPSSFQLKEETPSVGRVDGNGIVLPHQSISERHPEVVLQGEDVYVRDLGSTNGTYIEGNKGSESPPQPGEVLAFGEVELLASSPKFQLSRLFLGSSIPAEQLVIHSSSNHFTDYGRH